MKKLFAFLVACLLSLSVLGLALLGCSDHRNNTPEASSNATNPTDQYRKYAQYEELFEYLQCGDYDNANAYIQTYFGKVEYENPENALYPRFVELLGRKPLVCEVKTVHSSQDSFTMSFVDSTTINPDLIFETGDGSRLQLPMTYSQLCDAGWELEYGVTEEGLSDPLTGEEYVWCSFINKNGKTIHAEIGNYSSSPINLQDALVTQLQFGNICTESFTVNGIGQGSTVKDIWATFGTPEEAYYCLHEDGPDSFDLYYTSSDKWDHISFSLDAATGLLDSICYCVLLPVDQRPE